MTKIKGLMGFNKNCELEFKLKTKVYDSRQKDFIATITFIEIQEIETLLNQEQKDFLIECLDKRSYEEYFKFNIDAEFLFKGRLNEIRIYDKYGMLV